MRFRARCGPCGGIDSDGSINPVSLSRCAGRGSRGSRAHRAVQLGNPPHLESNAGGRGRSTRNVPGTRIGGVPGTCGVPEPPGFVGNAGSYCTIRRRCRDNRRGRSPSGIKRGGRVHGHHRARDRGPGRRGAHPGGRYDSQSRGELRVFRLQLRHLHRGREQQSGI